MRTVRIGSRQSALAIAQTRIVMEAIARHDPSVQMELVAISTKGDRHLDRSIEAVGGKGVFVKELEAALLDRRVDLCVHSLKDMEIMENSELPICAVGKREHPHDVLVLPQGVKELKEGGVVGCSSKRRQLQLGKLLPGCTVKPVRGNVNTRLQKLDAGEYDALVLAAAGLHRLGLWDRISSEFDIGEMLPACGQGIIAVQCRAGYACDYLDSFRDQDAWDITTAERAYLRAIGGGCSSAATANAQVKGQRLTIRGYAVNSCGNMVHGMAAGSRAQAGMLGNELAEYLKNEAEKR